MLLGAAVTIDDGSKKAAQGRTFLNRPQSEEWKGWMQTMFVLYHYFSTKEVRTARRRLAGDRVGAPPSVRRLLAACVAQFYNVIRVLIACYVFMTGYGNFSYFYHRWVQGAARTARPGATDA